MKKIIALFLICFMLQGCSLLKIATAPFQSVKNSVPQSTETSKSIMKCKGKVEVSPDGTIVCEKGFYQYNQNYAQTDRKLSFREKIAQFIARGAGYLVWGAIIFGVLTFMGLGGVATSIISSTFGVASKGLRQIISAIQKAKSDSPSLIQALEASTDEDTKAWITNFKIKNNIK